MKRIIERKCSIAWRRGIEEDWTRTMPRLLNELLQKKFTSTRKPTSTRVSHATEGVQWIRMEEFGSKIHLHGLTNQAF